MIQPTQKTIDRIVKHTLLNDGSTVDLHNAKFIPPDNNWYFPKYPSRTKIVDKENSAQELVDFIIENIDLLGKKDVVLGTWVNPTSQKCYLDITTKVADKNEALVLARKISRKEGRKIVTIYNPKLQKTEYVWDDVVA